ncbi:MAG: Fic family protein [Lentisphaeria bacterium]|nr:Fic family protein [Candidatus Neomarinimicrobiota bacterium]MCF7841949.1 Fic family protein [Lentisphaeria bacterium]
MNTTSDPYKPYNDLPRLPPPVEIETKAVLRKTTSCGRALAELKGIGRVIPNQALLIDSLILQEARASSEIENIVTTSDAVYKAFSAQTSQIDHATKEVLRYREALWYGFNELQRQQVLSTNLFVKCVQIIRENKAGIRKTPGTRIVNQTTGDVIYTPPEGEQRIRELLHDLEQFIHSEDGIDPLIKVALIHYQFEAIHPFSDGNGRTGRIINLLYLSLNDLLDYPVLYLSKYIIENRAEYYRLLRGVTINQSWEPWILYMLAGIEQTANYTRDKILAIKDLMDATTEKARNQLPGNVFSKELIELLFERPYTKIQYLTDKGIAKRETASKYLKVLETIHILKSQRVGKETLFLNTGLYNLLSRSN